MILITPFYRDPDPARQSEFFQCLERNAALEWIDEVHVFLEDMLDGHAARKLHSVMTQRKLCLVATGRRSTYLQLLQYANHHFAGRPVIVANADIYFDGSLACLQGFDLDNKLLCLSRWDLHADGQARLFEHPASQDCWIFKAPLREFACDFQLGRPGCDNRLAWEAARAGLALRNPARSVRAYHLHGSHVRRYSEADRIPGPGKAVPAQYLGTPARDTSPSAPDAEIAFRERMGYTVTHLRSGVSSHNNDVRPIRLPPPPLADRAFTQVVACRVSPVAVQFRTAGKLYVLAGMDWDGYETNVAWLSGRGQRESMPELETQHGTSFEVWSLTGAAGELHVLPTQAMLVARRLVRL